MSEWPKKNLGDICEVRIGRTPSRNNPEYWGSGESWLSIADMNQGRLLKTTKEQITQEASQKVMGPPAPAGTVALSFKLSIGKVGIMQRPMYTNEAIATLPIKATDLLGPEYLYWALKSVNLTQETDDAVMGKTLNKKKLSRLQIPIPPKRQQEAIVDTLDSLEDLCKKRLRSIELLDELTQSIFLDMFGDPGSKASPWVVKSFSDVIIGLRYGTSNKSTSSGFPALRIPNVVSGSLDLEEIKTVPASDAELERLRLEDGDLLFVRSNGNPEYVGRCALFIKNSVKITEYDPDNFIYASYLIRARPDQSQVNPVYVREFMLSHHGRSTLSKKSKTSAGQYNLNGKNLGSIPIPIPPLELQKEFEDKVSRISLQRAKHLAHLSHLDELFSSVQQRAFDGTLWDDPPIAS